MSIASIPGKMEATWNPDVKAVVDTWTSYSVKLEEFRAAVLETELPYAKKNGVKAWIVDSSKAAGTFSREIQDFIGTDIFPSFAKAGVKHFITVLPSNALTKLTVSSFSAKAGPNGLNLVEVSSLADALQWLKSNP
jgi:hypothetical protein